MQKKSFSNIFVDIVSWTIYPILGLIIAIFAFVYFSIKYLITPHPENPN